MRRSALGQPFRPNPSTNLAGVERGAVLRSFGTALAAVALAITLFGTAAANVRAGEPATVVVSAPADAPVAIDPPITVLAAGQSSLDAPPAFVVVSPESPTRTRGFEAPPVGAPVANADYRMWSSVPPGKANAAIGRFAKSIVSRTSSIAMNLTRSAMRFIGTPYVFGGTSAAGFDCSGYVQHVFAMVGLHVPRTADAQYYEGRRPLGGISAGDLVFFETYLPGPSHVGIYLGGGKFVHSSSHGVHVSSLGEKYWASRYLGAKRYSPKH
jgi:cell wall-associated NlpC family hydrolase